MLSAFPNKAGSERATSSRRCVDLVVENPRARYMKEPKISIHIADCGDHLHNVLEKLANP